MDVYTIHEVRPSACRSKQLLYESDRSSFSISELSLSYSSSLFYESDRSSFSISELSLSYSSSLFYGSIGAEGVSDADSQSGVVEPYRYPPGCSNSPSSYASPQLALFFHTPFLVVSVGYQ